MADHTVPAGAHRPINPPAEAHTPLELLDGWLSCSDQDEDHPRRVSIALALKDYLANQERRLAAFDVLAEDAFNLAAVIRAIGSRAETARPEHTIATEEHRVEIARALRVAHQLADTLGCKAANLAEVTHG